jgi:hypothetical protein
MRVMIYLAQAISTLSVYASNNRGHAGVVVRAAVVDGGRNEHNEVYDDETHRSSLMDSALELWRSLPDPEGTSAG